MKCSFLYHLRRKRQGYTLLELTLSIAFYTVIVTIALVGFLGIFGIYNKVQGLSRTQEEARKGMDVLSRDLRQATEVTVPSPMPSGVLRAYCLRVGTQSIGYGLKQVGTTSPAIYTLARSTNCTDYSQSVFVTSTDVWSEKGGNLDRFPSGAESFVIERVANTGGAYELTVWQVRFGVFRGESAPSRLDYNLDRNRYSAGTMLQSIVVVRG